MKMMLLVFVTSLLVSVVAAANDADVLILGAGGAGQMAAEYLNSKNVSFLIIEGAAEPGGRMKSQMFGGRMVEMGSTGIYALNNTKQKLVNMYNITGMYADFENVTVRTSDGQQPNVEADASWDRLAEAQKKVAELDKKIRAGKSPDMSMRVALDMANWFPKTPVDDVIEMYDYDYEFAKIPELIPTSSFMAANPYQEHPYLSNDQRGLQNILEKIKRDDSRLKLNEVVTKISHTASSVSVSTKSGKTFTGKYAIVTFSMGVLKSGSVTFEPQLPEWKLNTIYKTSMDYYTQIYVIFATGTTQFWGNDQFILHANPRRGYYPIIWNMEAANFAPTGKPMISFHVMGEEARRIEKATKATVKAEITDVLKKMYGASIPEPEDVLVTKWADNPLTLGSFSSREMGVDNPQFLAALNSPVGRVYFAGEAYPKNLDGFLVGAVMSGNMTVMNVYDCMMNNKCKMFDPNSYKPKPPVSVCGAAYVFISLPLLAASAISYLIL